MSGARGGSGWFLFSVRFSNYGESPPRKNLRGPKGGPGPSLGRQNGFQKNRWWNFPHTSSSYESSVGKSASDVNPSVAAPNEEEKNPKVGRAPSTAISTPVRVARGYKTPRVGLRAFGFRRRSFPSWRRARTLDAQRVVEVLGKENHADLSYPSVSQARWRPHPRTARSLSWRFRRTSSARCPWNSWVIP